MTACHPEHTRRQRFRGLQSQSLTREGFLQDEAPRPEDCLTSEWSDWSDCSTSCGRGWLTKERRVVAGPKNGGKACPRKLQKKSDAQTPCLVRQAHPLGTRATGGCWRTEPGTIEWIRERNIYLTNI